MTGISPAGPLAYRTGAAGGQRQLLMIKPGGGSEQTATPASLIVVFNWFEELKRLVPRK